MPWPHWSEKLYNGRHIPRAVPVRRRRPRAEPAEPFNEGIPFWILVQLLDKPEHPQPIPPITCDSIAAGALQYTV